MNWEILLISLAVFIAYFLSATFGFGDALILLPILSIFIDIEIAIVFTGFWGFPQSIYQVLKYREEINWSFLKYFLPLVVPGVFFGIWLIIYVESIWIQTIISIIIIIYSCANFWKFYINYLERERKIAPPFLFFGGMLYGTISSWTGTPGPISVIYLEYSGHYREKFIANNTAIVVLAGIFKLSLYLINNLFPLDYIWIFFIGLILCLIATRLGHIVTPKISIDKFRIIINLILLVVGIRLLTISLIEIF